MKLLRSLLPAAFLVSALAVTSVASADPHGAPVSGHVTVYVSRNNQAAYGALHAQSQSLGARLASYNARASTPTSSPTVYRALVTQKQQLSAEVARYNAAATNLARQSPAPPSRITIRR
jgi:hypothetical protein